MSNEPFSFAGYNRHLVGFDNIMKTLNSVADTYAKQAGGQWPPYNIVKLDENKYSIELAVAGFTKQNIDIEIANNTLIVKGGMTLDDMLESVPNNPVTYLYKGIADRVFTRKFTLADSIEVKDAELVNGMLKIFLENVIPDDKKPKKVDIK